MAGAKKAKFRHYVEYGLLLGFMSMFRLIGVERSSSFVGSLLRWLGPFTSPQKTAEDNLRTCLPELDEKQIKDLTRDMWENFGRTAGEFAFIPEISKTGPNGHIQVEGERFIDEALATGRSVIFISGHFANWEIIAPFIRGKSKTLFGVYRAANNPFVDKWIHKQRRQISFDGQLPKGREGARKIVECIKKNQHVAMLVDQKMNNGIEAPFFGRPSMTASAAALMAIKYDCPLVPLHMERVDGTHFILRFYQALPIVKTGNRTQDVLTVTSQYNAFLEQSIRRCPSQWLWMHKRWSKPIPKKKKRKAS